MPTGQNFDREKKNHGGRRTVIEIVLSLVQGRVMETVLPVGHRVARVWQGE
jgi:hypothetical protein